MAKERMVNTKFWDDPYITGLDPIEKLLYLYFITNPLTNICGIYEIQLRRIGFDTGIDKDMVQKILNRFEADKKIYFLDGWLSVVNFAKHQRDNPKVKKGIEIALKQVPVSILDRLSIDYASLSHSNTNINPNTNSNINTKNTAAKTAAPPTETKKKDPKDDPTPFSLKEYVAKMKESPQRHIRIIGDYADQISPKFSTKGQWYVFTNRSLRAARNLSPFTDDQIAKAFGNIEKNMKTEKNPKGYITKWTLETLLDFMHE